MKNERLLDAFGHIDEALIEEANPEKAKNIEKKQNHSWMKWIVAAACVMIVIGAAIPVLMPKKSADQMEGIEEAAEAETMAETTSDLPAEMAAGEYDWGITLAAKNVTSTGMTLVISQSGGNPTGELQCGSDYHLKVLKDEEWVDVPYTVEGDVAWTSVAYMIPMDDSREMEIVWEYLHGELDTGTYRISKEFADFRGTGDYDLETLYVEFEIK